MSAVTHAARVNRMYMSAITNACSIGSSSLVVETAELMIMAKSEVIEERRDKGLYS
jgi:hypothetical protein